MRTQYIRLDAGQSHFAWFDKGSRIVVLDGALAVTWRHGGLDWLPETPPYMRRVLDEGECMAIDTAGHLMLSADGSRPSGASIAPPAPRPGMFATFQAWLRRCVAQVLGARHARERS
ncbi:hypothetical protein [Burkholderia vietnamiensis]|uniref:hypothetical protein n=1 Tax=Burkholderia vietnamiensis TaxID=60552 RepID=UPI00075770BD|nr:hypothetical protein [Burkholderia vietnamiensis]KVE70998.1 hypothetical protein WI98_26415 [Burkholderia vietnamiensis]KVG09749.1 hypothetical protein WJ24_13900 [Burkholderia vietnamiensis]HDR9354654.1 hypothetical protein [Burkholderia vietnamiensis]